MLQLDVHGVEQLALLKIKYIFLAKNLGRRRGCLVEIRFFGGSKWVEWDMFSGWVFSAG